LPRFLLSILFIVSSVVYALPAEQTEVYFSFSPGSRVVLNDLIKYIAIDKRLPNGTVFAYARGDIFQSLSSYTLISSPNYSNVIRLEHESLRRSDIAMGSYDSVDSFKIGVYPDYDSYVKLMRDFAVKFPHLCKLEVIGRSVKGRELLALKISDNAKVDEKEPEVLLDSTIHGNELIGFPMLLKLAHELLTEYENDKQVKRVVDNTEIWIMPLRNPDGTYKKGNNTVKGASRFNANFVDLNRNFPDTQNRESVFSLKFEPETQSLVKFVSERNFVIGATIHAGAEVLNYPWDSMEEKHPDDAWFRSITREYVDLIHTVDSNYMNDLDDGITNGYAWYSIMGGFQDYMNYFENSRVITFELSTSKIPWAFDLYTYWLKNRPSILEFIEQAQKGINGVVVDSITGAPINAKVFINKSANNSPWVKTGTKGEFYRPLLPGKYSVYVEAMGYEPIKIENVSFGGGGEGSDLQVELNAI
jgi:uncharacterized short protein YbdD (DUF466 family)